VQIGLADMPLAHADLLFLNQDSCLPLLMAGEGEVESGVQSRRPAGLKDVRQSVQEKLNAAAEIPVYRVKQGDLRADALRSKVRGRKSDGVRWASMPLYVLGEDGGTGMIKRQCTTEYKVRPA
jgi:hypothetical protein